MNGTMEKFRCMNRLQLSLLGNCAIFENILQAPADIYIHVYFKTQSFAIFDLLTKKFSEFVGFMLQTYRFTYLGYINKFEYFIIYLRIFLMKFIFF